MKKLGYLLLALVVAKLASASVTLPYTFAPNTTIQSAQVNANFGAVRDEINTHEAAVNPHQTTLQSILQLNNSCGPYSINFNSNQALNMAVENLIADPSPATSGRIFYNTVTQLLKFDTGTSIVSIAGTGVNNLSSVLNSGNSAGAKNINMNENQLLAARVENLSSDPVSSSSNAGRLFFNTTSTALKVDTGAAIVAIGGSQGLSSVLGVSNSAGANNIDFNLNQAVNMIVEKLSSDPSGTTGRLYYNTASKIPKFYDGTSWKSVGNTNTLAQTLALGNSAGSSNIDFNGHQALNMALFNNAGSPGTGNGGLIWYDTGDLLLHYETSGANHTLASVDSSQTLTNKSISGSTNTLTNIPDNALSANVELLNGAQSVTGVKTFSTAPVIGTISSTSGATMAITAGIASDTFAFLNATQTLGGKTLTGPTFTGNTNFSEGIASNFRVENRSADPTAGNAGRIYYKTTTGELKYDDGSVTRVLTTGNPTLAQVLSSGNVAQTNLDMNDYQLLNARVENVSALPSAGNVGRMVYDTSNATFYLDSGAGWSSVGGGGVAYGPDTGVANTYVVTANPAVGSLIAGNMVNFLATNANTGASTLAVNGLAATPIVIPGGAALVAGDILANQMVSVVYDGTSFQLVSPQGQAVSANTAKSLVKRDASGNFSAGTITASLTGTASGNTTYTANNHGVVVSGSANAMTVVAPDVSLTKVLKSGGTSADPSWLAYDNANTASTLVFRDASGNFTAGTITAGQLIDSGLTASTVPYADSSKQLTSSAVTPTELGYLSGVTSAIQTQFTGKQATGSYLTALTGDGTASGPGSAVFTLATVNANVGSFGSSTAIPAFTVNGKGLITAASTNAVIAPAGTLTGTTLNSTVVTSSLTTVGTVGTGVWQGTAVATGYGGTGGSDALSGRKNLVIPPVVDRMTSGTGTYNLEYAFQITSGSATAAATYTNNGVTFTVYATVSSATLVYMSGSGAPAASGTLTKASGTGDSTLTFSSFSAPLYLDVILVAGGGGGAETGTATNGSDSTFGSSTAKGGSGAVTETGGIGGTGGTVAGTKIIQVNGGDGSGGPFTNSIDTYIPGGHGGTNPLGGAGRGASADTTTSAGKANTGAGGGGIQNRPSSRSGGGGGAGEYIEEWRTGTLSATYSWGVGAGGAGNGNGSAGGSGVLIVKALFQ